MAELPKLITERILMAAVRDGGDRQELHELIRKHSGVDPGNLLSSLKKSRELAPYVDAVATSMDPIDLVGTAPEQVLRFLDEVTSVLSNEQG